MKTRIFPLFVFLFMLIHATLTAQDFIWFDGTKPVSYTLKASETVVTVAMDMFADDINRKINGVIKVDQAADDMIEQELNEYVISRELKKHFITFFNYYGDAFDQPTADMGVWISGFFGSGKSHFLKMLSYLLENKEVKGIRSVERFRK